MFALLCYNTTIVSYPTYVVFVVYLVRNTDIVITMHAMFASVLKKKSFKAPGRRNSIGDKKFSSEVTANPNQ